MKRILSGMLVMFGVLILPGVGQAGTVGMSSPPTPVVILDDNFASGDFSKWDLAAGVTIVNSGTAYEETHAARFVGPTGPNGVQLVDFFSTDGLVGELHMRWAQKVFDAIELVDVFKLESTADGGQTWEDVVLFSGLPIGEWELKHVILPPELMNNPQAGIRFSSNFANGNDQVRIDVASITVIPEPASLALALVGIIISVATKRRLIT